MTTATAHPRTYGGATLSEWADLATEGTATLRAVLSALPYDEARALADDAAAALRGEV